MGPSCLWGADGRAAFGRDGDIWTWTPGIDAIEDKIFDNGNDPSLAGNIFAFERLGSFSGEFGVDDIHRRSRIGVDH